jgi:hypothetical protein
MNRNHFARLALALLLTLALLSTGCGPELAPPASFGALDSGAYDYRAATPHGVVIAARSEKNKPRAEIDFWSRAVDVRLRRDGYAKASEGAIATDRGLPGVEMRYTREKDGRAYDYVIALFVKKRRVYVVEAAGDKEDFAPARADVEQAIRSLRE